ncbi:MAG TPA: hypothetical protein VHS09_10580 [Polyangiaceae bacterium]|nr:hypothetical protein [Polyangiaceae bacterium]
MFFVLAAGVAAAAGGSAGCSSSSAAPTSPEPATFCPATIDDTVGATCNAEGVVCSPTFPCGIATVTVACTCMLGTFQCVDGMGNPFTAGETPVCGDAGGPLAACPATEGAASIGSCTRPQSGQQCAYAPKCTGGTLAYDLCTCEPLPTGAGYAWECQNSCNSGTGPLPDAGSSSGGQDAAGEAQPPEAGSAGDGASDAASDATGQ